MLVNGVTGLADCGNWAVSASWSTADAVSGIYVAKLTRTDNGGASHIVFIVRDDARQADVVVQTSDTTWQAYNRYGGGSLYCGGPHSNAGTVYSCAGRATKVSYNRPFDTRAHEPPASCSTPNTRWCASSRPTATTSSTSAAWTPSGVRAIWSARRRSRKRFSRSATTNTWSAGQRASVEAARNAGVNLAFFSGNEMYWKTRFEPSIDGTTTPYRTLVGYKDTLGGVKLDPMPGVTTGTWRDTRFGPPVADGGRPENGLIGQIWTVNSGTSAISVPASMASLRFWNNTRVENLTSGAATLGTDTLGYEWGEDLDNGARPAGLIHLSSTTVNGVEKILDFGETVGIGTATHNLTLYRHASGALVFGAGTVQWAWGLDGNHDRGSAPPDQAMQQATVNLLADMGAQPGFAADWRRSGEAADRGGEVRRRLRADLGRHLAGRRRDGRERRSRDHHRHRVRQRRRHRRRRRSVGRRRHDVARRAGHVVLDLRVDAGRARLRHDPHPRDRRQRQPRSRRRRLARLGRPGAAARARASGARRRCPRSSMRATRARSSSV